MSQQNRKPQPEATALTLADFYLAWQTLNHDDIVVDVRSSEDHQQGHIPGSRNIPYAHALSQLSSAQPPGHVYLHCYGGEGSGHIARQLAELGFNNISYLANAGFAQWQAAGHPVSR
ncbi:MAG: rhodanese-like domain-containing protein [Gammaproteobacteria bacterium]|nr:rhodanese-like domain-containing protein [Gammaproteobacteria bacterium]